MHQAFLVDEQRQQPETMRDLQLPYVPSGRVAVDSWEDRTADFNLRRSHQKQQCSARGVCAAYHPDRLRDAY